MGSDRASRLAVSSRRGLGEFRHSGRQFVHVVHDQRSSVSLQTSPVLRAAMASTGEADCGHAGGELAVTVVIFRGSNVEICRS
jgi:hypothetical protein